MKVTNHDLHIMLTEMRADIKSVAKEVGTLTQGFESHIINDAVEFKTVNDNIANMSKYASSIAAVASIIGVGVGLGWEWIKNKVTGA